MKFANLPKLAFVSVYDKTGIVEFATEIARLGWKIASSGGTALALKAGGVSVISVEEIVTDIYRCRLRSAGIEPGHIEAMIQSNVFCIGPILNHRVVTLRPEIHGGLISDLSDPDHIRQLIELSIPTFGMVVCDFYPLEQAIAKPGATVESVIHDTDIGGPCMVRSAAKGGRAVICQVVDRKWVLDELRAYNHLSLISIQRLRAIAERVVGEYCLASSRFHLDHLYDSRST